MKPQPFASVVHGAAIPLAILLLVVPARPVPAWEPGTGPAGAETVDHLLGQRGREAHARLLANRFYGGNTFSWEQYASWGRELAVKGYVEDPPTGKGPSPKLAEHYRCVHCHNLGREDEKLGVQDPEARAKQILAQRYEKPDARDGRVVSLTPGTTLWGAVNRERFYNGHYQTYHRLTVSGGEKMNPEKLADAIQVCCRYCSGGRFPDPWELDSLLALLWDLELRLDDLDLPADDAKKLLGELRSSDKAVQADARKQLKRHYLTAAGATRQTLPISTERNVDEYGDQRNFAGDAKSGKFLYLSACAGCHGTDINPLDGKKLVEQARRFHQFVWKGTERDGLYMPFYPVERLSRQQAADIRAYLEQ